MSAVLVGGAGGVPHSLPFVVRMLFLKRSLDFFSPTLWIFPRCNGNKRLFMTALTILRGNHFSRDCAEFSCS